MGVKSTKSQQTADLRPGVILAGRFEIIRRIGRGGVGTIWLAADRHLEGDPVACKVLNADLSENREALADLKREVLVTRRLRHPHILPVYTFWEDGPYRFVTMEYAEGSSLADKLVERDGPFTPRELLPWIEQVCGALDYAHSKGVLHRDVKPANILLSGSGAVQLADFGIARAIIEADSQEKGRYTKGTLYYMSPEQLQNGELDGRSDLYSVAVSVYELLCGAPPFQGPNLIAQIQLEPPRPLEHLNGVMNEVLLAALAKHPSRRPDTCAAFHEAFHGAMGKNQDALPAHAMARLDPDQETEVIAPPTIETRRSRLGRVLLEAGLLGQGDLADALMEQQKSGDKLGTVLTRLGYVTEDQLVNVVSGQLGIPVSNIAEEDVDIPLARQLGESNARAFDCLPIRAEDDQIIVAMGDPLNLMAVNHLEQLYRKTIAPRLATEADIVAAIDLVFR